MRLRKWLLVVLVLSLVGAACGGDDEDASTTTTTVADTTSTSAAQEPLSTLTIWTVFPAGSGNHQTATVMQQALQEEGLVSQVNVVPHEGGNGTLAITELVSQTPEDTVLVAGFGEVGASIAGGNEVRLTDTTPLGRLMGEPGVIVVPADSEYQDLQQLLDAVEADPGAVPLGIGNAGGVDDVFLANLATESGIDASQLNRVVFAGGGELLVSLLGGHIAGAATGLGETIEQVQAGELRILTVSTAEHLDAVPDAPSLGDFGLEAAETVNWRGVYGPPGLSEEQRALLVDLIADMVDSQTWGELAATNGWLANYIGGDEFAEFLASEYERLQTVMEGLGLVD